MNPVGKRTNYMNEQFSHKIYKWLTNMKQRLISPIIKNIKSLKTNTLLKYGAIKNILTKCW